MRKFSDLNPACSKMLVHVEIFQFQDMLNESERYCDETNGLLYLKPGPRKWHVGYFVRELEFVCDVLGAKSLKISIF